METSDDARTIGTDDGTSRSIRALNDALRQTLAGGQYVVTAGVAALGTETVSLLLDKVCLYSAFTPDNDPYGEHDFGAFDHAGSRFFWKIDYYDRSLTVGSEDPADPERTTRVLTLMKAEDY